MVRPKSLIAVIVSGPDGPRNESLESSLTGISSEVIVVNGPSAGSLHTTSSARQRFYEWLRHGRSLTPGEHAARIAHEAAYRVLLSSDSEVALIVEDDVNFDDTGVQLDTLLSEVDQRDAILIVLYSGQALKGMTKQAPPITMRYTPGAVTYMISRRGAELALRSSGLGEKADWPGWAGGVSYRLCPQSGISLAEVESLVGFRPAISQSRAKRLARYGLSVLALPFFIQPQNFSGSLATYYRDLRRRIHAGKQARLLFRSPSL